MIDYIKNLMGVTTNTTTELFDNRIGDTTDIVGSVVEWGFIAAAFIAGCIITWPLVLTAWKYTKKKKPYLSNIYYDCHSRVYEILTELRVNTDCARVQVVQFHNGGNFFDGNPMAKMTMTHESLRNGVSMESKNWTDLQMPLMIHLLDKTKTDKSTLHIVSEDEDSYSKSQLDAANVLAYSVAPIYKKGVYSGFLMCQWCAWSKVDNIDAEHISLQLIDARNRLQIQLEREKNKWQRTIDFLI
jgi:hypothetical protein